MAEKSGKAPDVLRVRRLLLRWFAGHRRELPWRRRGDAYAVWVSEIMLQQTQVATAEPYYVRFLERFADVESLAEAGFEEVLKQWEGLGYYSRARNLHRTAKLVVGEYGGEFPSEAAELRKLPGIGRYTAGAIASIAFGRDEAVVDGNVARVLCRLFDVGGPVKSSAVQKRLWRLAEALAPRGRAGDFNQALMDLGALACTVRSPACEGCPVRSECLGRARGRQERLPNSGGRQPTPHYDVAAAIIRKVGRVLIDRRPSTGLLAGMWEFPGGKREAGETLEEAVVREVREEVGIEVEVVERFVAVDHAYSHFRITLHTFLCRHVGGRARAIGCDAVRWVGVDELEKYPFPAANRKVIAALKDRAACGR